VLNILEVDADLGALDLRPAGGLEQRQRQRAARRRVDHQIGREHLLGAALAPAADADDRTVVGRHEREHPTLVAQADVRQPPDAPAQG
jgi:hypothetical protein